MFTLRKGAIVSLGMFAGVGMNAAQACDNDRFPCPVVSEAVTQETAAAPAEPVQVAQPPKKASQSATKPREVRLRFKNGWRFGSQARRGTLLFPRTHPTPTEGHFLRFKGENGAPR